MRQKSVYNRWCYAAFFFLISINRVFMFRVQHNILKVIYILRWSEVKSEYFLKKPKEHFKVFPNLLLFGFVFHFVFHLVVNRVFKGKQIEKIIRQRCRKKSLFQKIKMTAYCSLYILLDFLHFHQNDCRSIPI